MARNLDYPMPMHGRMMRQRLWEVQRDASALYDTLRDDDRVPAWTLDKVATGGDRIGQVSRYLRFKVSNPIALGGAEESQIGMDTAKVAAATTGGAVTGASTAAALVTAGAASATVPVVGWIVGGVLAATGGTIALCIALKDGKVRKDEAIALAKKLGFGKLAEEVPAFTVAAFKWPKAQRKAKLAALKKQYAGMKGKTGIFPKLYAKDRDRVRMKIRILKTDTGHVAYAVGVEVHKLDARK
jgi:hypothetical protein